VIIKRSISHFHLLNKNLYEGEKRVYVCARARTRMHISSNRNKKIDLSCVHCISNCVIFINVFEKFCPFSVISDQLEIHKYLKNYMLIEVFS